ASRESPCSIPTICTRRRRRIAMTGPTCWRCERRAPTEDSTEHGPNAGAFRCRGEQRGETMSMRWEDFRQSGNIEDRRGEDYGSGGGGGLSFGGGGLGIGTMIVLGIIGYALGIDPRILISGAEMASGGSRSVYVEPQRQQ